MLSNTRSIVGIIHIQSIIEVDGDQIDWILNKNMTALDAVDSSLALFKDHFVGRWPTNDSASGIDFERRFGFITQPETISLVEMRDEHEHFQNGEFISDTLSFSCQNESSSSELISMAICLSTVTHRKWQESFNVVPQLAVVVEEVFRIEFFRFAPVLPTAVRMSQKGDNYRVLEPVSLV